MIYYCTHARSEYLYLYFHYPAAGPRIIRNPLDVGETMHATSAEQASLPN